ncbi:MAG: HD-GYP domain-containing protein [Lachnospiraceae bacterium]|nr:HD-GYP domain-containing protein [Lachnospiraceae bacterium]
MADEIRDKTGYAASLDDVQIEGLMTEAVTDAQGTIAPENKEGAKAFIGKTVQAAIGIVKSKNPSSIKVSENVKKRVARGIQYLYSNSSSDRGALDATENVADELLLAIENNPAVVAYVETMRLTDEYIFKHSVDVATMSMVIAKNYGLDEYTVREIGIAGLLHDVGKLRIPKDILDKPSRLTNEEFEQIKRHAQIGYDMLSQNGSFSEAILMGVLQHHEKLSGSGYPNGLKGDEIHIYAKIIAIADIYDSLVTKRSYKQSFSKRDAIEIIMGLTSELDIFVMQSFLASVILYPVDSIVSLSNGEEAKVVKNNPGFLLRPNVVGVRSGRLYKLAEDISCASIVIL